ncbi:unnamed protein product [Vitrella brassicaformis CCMP3155]|uniref:Uncharacterized protein n=1 Tax=Vitrella brassicaformis (strain CCMP3155) TaxID=1169540 RepID=A0A0G4EG03_VITBC|nr:unnamed protein product [Vitrella brassicaformis CCMP3155]|eukprot:CEL94632.1 unnamed protein product [Vitrella brassicaformis CCMP3155]
MDEGPSPPRRTSRHLSVFGSHTHSYERRRSPRTHHRDAPCVGTRQHTSSHNEKAAPASSQWSLAHFLRKATGCLDTDTKDTDQRDRPGASGLSDVLGWHTGMVADDTRTGLDNEEPPFDELDGYYRSTAEREQLARERTYREDFSPRVVRYADVCKEDALSAAIAPFAPRRNISRGHEDAPLQPEAVLHKLKVATVPRGTAYKGSSPSHSQQPLHRGGGGDVTGHRMQAVRRGIEQLRREVPMDVLSALPDHDHAADFVKDALRQAYRRRIRELQERAASEPGARNELQGLRECGRILALRDSGVSAEKLVELRVIDNAE